MFQLLPVALNHVMQCVLCVVLCSHIVQEMPLGDFFNEQYTFAMKVNALNLTDGEIGLLTAIMILNPGQLFIVHLLSYMFSSDGSE